MGIEQAEGAGVDRLRAAVFEQRRLSHMLRQRGAEIEVLQGERERLVARERKVLEREESLRRELGKAKDRLTELSAEHERLQGALDSARKAAAEEQALLRRELEKVQGQAAEERERSEEELGRARYEARRADRRVSKAESAVAEERRERDRLGGEVARLEREAGKRRHELEATKQEATAVRRDLSNVQKELTRNAEARAELEVRFEVQGGELERSRYEARRGERRVAKAEAALENERKQSRLQRDALAAELRQAASAHEAEMARRATDAKQQAEQAVGLLDSARQLGRAQRELELLLAAEREREVVLVAADRMLGEVAEQLRRVRASRSWRWGHRLARLLRALTLRRRPPASALDTALGRLEGEMQTKASPG